MQRPDPKKRSEILKVAERLFATRPFHEVKLDDVAAKARIGKGTIYIYFRSKEDLYLSLLRDGTLELLERLRRQLTEQHRPSRQELRLIVAELVGFAAARPGMYQLLRTVLPKPCEGGLVELRKELVQLIEGVIERGIARRELSDPQPRLTAELILASVRGAMLFGPKKLTAEQLVEHITRIFGLALKRQKVSER